MLTLAEVKKYYDHWYSSVQETDSAVVEMMSAGRRPDLLTPLAKGKEWLYELTQQHQPRTGQLLMNGGELGLGCKLGEGSYLCHLFEDVQGQAIQISRMVKGDNPSDPDYQNRRDRLNAKLTKERGRGAVKIEKHQSLPDPVRLAYYHRFNGLNIPDHPAIGIVPRISPRATNSWYPIDRLLGDLRLKKKYLPLIDEMFPDVLPTHSDFAYSFSAFLNSWDSFIGKKRTEGDQLFVKTECRDGVVYYLRDADVPNLMVLTDPAEAIDRYCEHNLLRKEGRFDFRPWAVPFTG